MKYDVVIKNGTIIDPKRRKTTIANLGILNGKIILLVMLVVLKN